MPTKAPAFLPLAAKLFAGGGYRNRYRIKTAANACTKEVALCAVEELLRDNGCEFSNIEITKDASGAPHAAVFAGEREDEAHSPLISLTDDSGLASCIAVLKSAEGPAGVGIDIAGIDDAAGLLAASRKTLSGYFTEDELEFLFSLPEGEAGLWMAVIFSAKEAAFKSLSVVYDRYRRKNGGKRLSVSFLDFGLSHLGSFEMGALPQGDTYDICRREGLDVTIGATYSDGLVGTLALCRAEK